MPSSVYVSKTTIFEGNKSFNRQYIEHVTLKKTLDKLCLDNTKFHDTDMFTNGCQVLCCSMFMYIGWRLNRRRRKLKLPSVVCNL